MKESPFILAIHGAGSGASRPIGLVVENRRTACVDQSCSRERFPRCGCLAVIRNALPPV